MLITHLRLKNWRNFQTLDVPLRDTAYLLGPNASGKSNLLDTFRFLRDISKSKGGGLQTAVADRGGISKLRCLHARRDPEVKIDVELADSADMSANWRYILAFKPEGKGAQRLLISQEQVWKGNELILSRPNSDDRKDSMLLTQTHLEQIQANGSFRELVDFFGATTYLHLVPQLLKYADKIGGQRLEDDPFGQGFLERLARTNEKTRNSRLAKINVALTQAVPQFKELRFEKDDLGHPHLHALYAHHRPNAGWQSEEHFSDGTLRLLGLLWALLDGNSLLLLEEPEISLNDAIVKEIPLILHRLQRNKKVKRQIILSTHSEALLSNPGIDGRGVLLLESSAEGTKARTLQDTEMNALDSGFSVAEVVLPKTRPASVNQLGLW
ncbi:AAA family ATPase [Methylomonas sp. SURF-1]|uniref:AAA family ATPase n=1 Tax=Methylomonas aurea TaxID=2952224 RepID=A0ABT1UE38_9GAMM|nr:AAA family ATPase [Methylomonas sp. SURF-1]MCQ8180108.1 AAA family ATPase [Methylomonas sp. SURF-1]